MKKTEQSSPFDKALFQTEKQLSKTNAAMEEVRFLAERRDLPAAYEKAFELSDATEKLALSARSLPAYTGHPAAKHTMRAKMLDNSPVRIGFTAEGWLCFVIPALLPKKGKGGTQYIHDMMYTALTKFMKMRSPIRFTNCTVAFCHIYQKNRPERQWRDHDNIELNMVIDIIARHILTDDGPRLCDHYYCSASGTHDQTEIYIIPEQDFTRFHQGAKKHRNRDIILREK